jgi:hypothetical protein
MAFLQNPHENFDFIVTMLKKGIPNIVRFGSWARRDIIKRLGVIEEEFHTIDENIIQDIGKEMVKFIYKMEDEDINYSVALEIMIKWAGWKGDAKKQAPMPPDPKPESHKTKEDVHA